MKMMIFDGSVKRPMTDEEISEYNAGVAARDAEYHDVMRNRRNTMLSECDWTQMPDSPLASAEKSAWATYRQALRDITTHPNWPKLEEADWPTKPD